MIDPVTGWFEISQYNDKRSIYIAKLFETTWLSRYSRPIQIMYDQGNELLVKSSENIQFKHNTG